MVLTKDESGTIADGRIQELAQDGILIAKEFDESCVKQACYELRASDTYYQTNALSTSPNRMDSEAGYILRPHSYVTIVTMETVKLPHNVLARILTKGQLFSIGILPVNTYVDPGFEGRLGITIANMSHRHLVIRPGSRLAKAEFVVLPVPVTKPYTGIHGFADELWPLPTEFLADTTNTAMRGLIHDKYDELNIGYGGVVAQLARDVDYYGKTVWIQIILMLSMFTGIAYLYGKIEFWAALGLGVLGNLLSMGLVHAWKHFANG